MAGGPRAQIMSCWINPGVAPQSQSAPLSPASMQHPPLAPSAEPLRLALPRRAPIVRTAVRAAARAVSVRAVGSPVVHGTHRYLDGTRTLQQAAGAVVVAIGDACEAAHVAQRDWGGGGLGACMQRAEGVGEPPARRGRHVHTSHEGLRGGGGEHDVIEHVQSIAQLRLRRTRAHPNEHVDGGALGASCAQRPQRSSVPAGPKPPCEEGCRWRIASQ